MKILFSILLGGFFIFLDGITCCTKVLNFDMRPVYLVFIFLLVLLVLYLWNLCLTQDYEDLLLRVVFYFYITVCDPFWVNFCLSYKEGCPISFFCMLMCSFSSIICWVPFFSYPGIFLVDLFCLFIMKFMFFICSSSVTFKTLSLYLLDLPCCFHLGRSLLYCLQLTIFSF